MPAGFERCVKARGKVKRISGPNKRFGLKEGEYVNVCILNGSFHRGELHHSHTPLAKAAS